MAWSRLSDADGARRKNAGSLILKGRAENDLDRVLSPWWLGVALCRLLASVE